VNDKEVEALVLRAQSGDDEALMETITNRRMQRYIQSLVNRYASRKLRMYTPDDMKQEAVICLVEVVRGYKVGEERIPFWPKVYNAIRWRLSALLKKDPLIALPHDTNRVWRVERELEQEGIEATDAAVSEVLGTCISEEKVAAIRCALMAAASLDAPTHDKSTLYDMYIEGGVMQPTEEAAIDSVSRDEARAVIEGELEDLGELEREAARACMRGERYEESAMRRARRKLKPVLAPWELAGERKYRGVYRLAGETRVRWGAILDWRENGTRHKLRLGVYKTPRRAAQVVDEAAMVRLGKRFNFPAAGAGAQIAAP
jgi:hypothetical protein